MNAHTILKRVSHGMPAGTMAHWLLRMPLALIMLQQGFTKAPITAADAASFGVPVALWAMAAMGEIIAGGALILGGVAAHLAHTTFQRRGADLITRGAGLAIALIVASVIYVAYWAPPLDILLYNQFHVLLLVGGLFFALRGNRA